MKTLTKTVVLLTGLCLATGALAQKLAVIVNVSNPASSITKEQVQDFYYRKVRQWPDGTALRFFDRGEDSPERSDFLKSVMKKTARQLDQYWISQKLVSGASAPTPVGPDRLVESLVSRFPGGMSYVSESFVPSKGVKVLKITGD